jgi:GxxExxY protein
MSNDSPDPINKTTGLILGGAIRVHRVLGPGLFESAYEVCLVYELRRAGLEIVTGQSVPICYEGVTLGTGYRLDIVVNQMVIVELKSVNALAPIHTAQMITYLKLTGLPVGLLINFNVTILKNGIKRLLNPDRARTR